MEGNNKKEIQESILLRIIISGTFVFFSVCVILWFNNVSGILDRFHENFSADLESLERFIERLDWNRFLTAFDVNVKAASYAVPIGFVLSLFYNILYLCWVSGHLEPIFTERNLRIITYIYSGCIYAVWFFVFAAAFMFRFYRLADYWTMESGLIACATIIVIMILYVWIECLVFFNMRSERRTFIENSPLKILYVENVGSYVLGIVLCLATSYFAIAALVIFVVLTVKRMAKAVNKKEDVKLSAFWNAARRGNDDNKHEKRVGRKASATSDDMPDKASETAEDNEEALLEEIDVLEEEILSGIDFISESDKEPVGSDSAQATEEIAEETPIFLMDEFEEEEVLEGDIEEETEKIAPDERPIASSLTRIGPDSFSQEDGRESISFVPNNGYNDEEEVVDTVLRQSAEDDIAYEEEVLISEAGPESDLEEVPLYGYM